MISVSSAHGAAWTVAILPVRVYVPYVCDRQCAPCVQVMSAIFMVTFVAAPSHAFQSYMHDCFFHLVVPFCLRFDFELFFVIVQQRLSRQQ